MGTWGGVYLVLVLIWSRRLFMVRMQCTMCHTHMCAWQYSIQYSTFFVFANKVGPKSLACFVCSVYSSLVRPPIVWTCPSWTLFCASTFKQHLRSVSHVSNLIFYIRYDFDLTTIASVAYLLRVVAVVYVLRQLPTDGVAVCRGMIGFEASLSISSAAFWLSFASASLGWEPLVL